jgi:diadenosine tetraphosphate (Ap4A) HIT family hydrolase
MTFSLHERLAKDCVPMTRWRDIHILLQNTALVPWFVLVPQTQEKEVCALPPALRADLRDMEDRVSGFILRHFDASKLNVAAIGNLVPQLHIHVIGRRPDDYAWPGVVWGRSEREPRTAENIAQVRDALIRFLETT